MEYQYLVINDNTSYRAMVGDLVEIVQAWHGGETVWLSFPDVPHVPINFDASEVTPYSDDAAFLLGVCRLEDYGWVAYRD